MRTALIVQCALSSLGIALVAPSYGATTGARTYAQIQGVPVDEHSMSGGNGGALTASNLTILNGAGAVDVNASASAQIGALRVSASSRANVGTDGVANATATWVDGFTISAAGHAPGEVGSFSGSVFVSGGLLAEFEGTAYADTYVIAELRLDPRTGFNGGIVALQGGSRKSTGSDIGFTHTGSEFFSLYFTNVPFTYGREVSTTLSLGAVAGTRTFNTSSAHAEADYGHTMVWGGLTEVRDSTGQLVSTFSALSSTGSGFNFASAVPEPTSATLLVGGLLLIVATRPGRRWL